MKPSASDKSSPCTCPQGNGTKLLLSGSEDEFGLAETLTAILVPSVAFLFAMYAFARWYRHRRVRSKVKEVALEDVGVATITTTTPVSSSDAPH